MASDKQKKPTAKGKAPARTNAAKRTEKPAACDDAGGEDYGLSELHHMAWFQLLRAHAAVHRVLERRLDTTSGATPAWYDVLVTLEKAPGGRLRMSELADNVMLSRSGLTRSVDKLEAAGMLQRANCPNDRRGCYAEITEKGLAWRRAAWPGHAQNIAELFAQHVTEEEARAMVEALSKVADAAGRSSSVDQAN